MNAIQSVKTRIVGVYPDYKQASARVDDLLGDDVSANIMPIGHCWLVQTAQI